ncbi:hypothetical protein ACFVFS_18340 [Kitasatospora sp. NPDC057692]|uniref:hypothetical protein n=1 Tax=Kitasatospora sp. NPDC057692 TaxID=3346215 RepID=UPI00367BC2BA
MDELTFRSKDRYRWSWNLAVTAAAAAAIAVTRAVYDLGATTVLWMIGGVAVLAVPRLLARDAWSTVGPEGITIRGSYGRRARSHPWTDVRWIEVYELDHRFGNYRTLQIHFADGRSRFLSGLIQDRTHPSPDFDEQVHRVRNWWRLSTDPAARVRPPERLLGLPTSQLVALIVLLVAGTALPAVVLHWR